MLPTRSFLPLLLFVLALSLSMAGALRPCSNRGHMNKLEPRSAHGAAAARSGCRRVLVEEHVVEERAVAVSDDIEGDTDESEEGESGKPVSRPPVRPEQEEVDEIGLLDDGVPPIDSVPMDDNSNSTLEDTWDDDLKDTAGGWSLTPNGIKAGIAGGDAYPYLKDHIGWWYDWSPNPSKPGRPTSVPMLWGGGTSSSQDAARLASFKRLVSDVAQGKRRPPPYVLGFEEPDCPSGKGSAGMGVGEGVRLWDGLMGELLRASKGKGKRVRLGSPSMCKQADETWLNEFENRVKTRWDFTAVHINKNSLEGVKKDIEHYAKYGKPIWVTEFACVNDHHTFTPCTSQLEINRFINEIVPYLEAHPKVFAYAYSNGLGLGDKWPLVGRDGKLSASGRTYLAAISRYH